MVVVGGDSPEPLLEGPSRPSFVGLGDDLLSSFDGGVDLLQFLASTVYVRRVSLGSISSNIRLVVNELDVRNAISVLEVLGLLSVG